jgi:hypothetical protein
VDAPSSHRDSAAGETPLPTSPASPDDDADVQAFSEALKTLHELLFKQSVWQHLGDSLHREIRASVWSCRQHLSGVSITDDAAKIARHLPPPGTE